jgi:hypothetical protein
LDGAVTSEGWQRDRGSTVAGAQIPARAEAVLINMWHG